MPDIKCTSLEWDSSNNSVTIRGKSGNIILTLKLTDPGIGTMERIFDEESKNQDCDNYWIGVKPSDDVVFEQILFDRGCEVKVNKFEFSLEGGKIRKSRGIS